MQKYDVNSMISIEAGTAYRTKLGMYLDGDKQTAINLGLRELVVNAQDEYSVYKPKNALLEITLNTKDRIISVRDNLRGIPVGIRKDGINSLTAAFLIPHSGAKHDEEGAYASAIGINGQGLKVVTHTAKQLFVEVWRDKTHFSAKFESNDEGAHLVGDIEAKPIAGNENKTGTLITYSPDKAVYGDIFVDLNDLRKMLKELSMFTKGLKIILKVDDNDPEEFLSKYGLIESLKNKNAMSKPFTYSYSTKDCEVELALQWVSKTGKIKGYGNGLYMPSGGPFMTGFKTTLTRKINTLSGNKFSGERIRSCLDGIVSVKVKLGDFSNQQKSLLGNPEAREPTSKAISDCLDKFYKERRVDFDKVIELLSKLDKAEKAADKARSAVMGAHDEIKNNNKKKVFSTDKLKDAEFLGQDSVLLIAEGKSAVSALSKGRDTKKYGLVEIRGKMINTLRNDIEATMENQEVQLILSALNIVPGEYDSSKLRYGSVGIAVDADSDGSHIALLIITFFLKLAPEFLKENRLYWLRAPLYISNGRYFYSEEEYQKAGSPTANLKRAKGLGALNEKETREGMFGKYQRMEVIKWDNNSTRMIEELMGKDMGPRRDFVFNKINFSEIHE